MSGKAFHVDYVWLDASGQLRSERLSVNPTDYNEVPTHTVDGGVVLYPFPVYHDPYNAREDVIAFCELYGKDGNPSSKNTRRPLRKSLEQTKDFKFGYEQEFTVSGSSDSTTKGILDKFVRACRYAGIETELGSSGSSHKFKVGPLAGMDGPDQFCVARHLLNITAKQKNVKISFRSPCKCSVIFSVRSGGEKVVQRSGETDPFVVASEIIKTGGKPSNSRPTSKPATRQPTRPNSRPNEPAKDTGGSSKSKGPATKDPANTKSTVFVQAETEIELDI